ncbi:hypothetical protein IJ21_16920 [Paenibacillus sp. 32O-W]|uniref:hypothetical protein n=1 Tax=Paenibacillus sp. 32O-W TaxID=1695218 RepID=UPI0007204283|nr:hypothetical protein [Paenibacillus sp. 32O-W]ALS27093.1 hypothetical protein IJ21_16920 [Paenibacillus sp. 32O-W]
MSAILARLMEKYPDLGGCEGQIAEAFEALRRTFAGAASCCSPATAAAPPTASMSWAN